MIKIYWNTIEGFCHFTVDLICSHKLTHFFIIWPRIWIVGDKSFKNSKYSQRWILRWSFVEQLYQLTFLQNTSWFLQKNYFLSFSTKGIFLLLFLGQRRSLNITPRKWYLTETFNKNLKIWILVSSEVIPDSSKTIDDQYLHLPFLAPKL